jgi:SM-20-related protein
VINFARIEKAHLATDPFEWALVTDVFSGAAARALAVTFPRDSFKTVSGYADDRGWAYESRALIPFGTSDVAGRAGLSRAWRRLADDLRGPAYRAAMTRLTGRDLTTAPMEAYVCHFGPGGYQGPHRDLPEKIVTHVFYFNATWSHADGGCLAILRSREVSDVAREVPPIVGGSAVIVRSERSWHAVSAVVDGVHRSRRTMNVIFYQPGAVSTMWPPGDATPLHRYDGGRDAADGLWRRLALRAGLAS